MSDGDRPQDDMSQYLQTFLDETEEQLDDLVEVLLALESDATNEDGLNEAFRLIHSIKGSAGMMGLESISVLTHHLEDRFEKIRSGFAQLDLTTANLVLRCVDFFRQCVERLRNGEELNHASELLAELKELEMESNEAEDEDVSKTETGADTPTLDTHEADIQFDDADATSPRRGPIKIEIQFRAGLPLADLKGQLILSRLEALGTGVEYQPELSMLEASDGLFQVWLDSLAMEETIREAVDVEGVETVTIRLDEEDAQNDIEAPTATTSESDSFDDASRAPSVEPSASESELDATAETALSESKEEQHSPQSESPTAASDLSAAEESASNKATKDGADSAPTEEARRTNPTASPRTTIRQDESAVKIGETMRIDIDRLDNLLNLAGELVVNRARLVQISERVNPALRKANMINRIRDFGDGLEQTIELLESDDLPREDLEGQVQQLRAGLELMAEQVEVWESGRQSIQEITEAIDQLSRVSHSLQRGVLETRMVPVAPLFNRFKRVVRDLCTERGKQVNLVIRGEKTELDKRMIDDLGEPLMHLVRNSIDHGLEVEGVRRERGKPTTGTILLEASHSGNNIYIHIRDDGGGIDADKIRAKVVDRGLLSETQAAALSDQEMVDFIWHPGFSTASQVTDVSGRGVGMDVVKTRINKLNGMIEVDSRPGEGTTFTIRLPLTLAIINSLLVELHGVIFSLPMDDVREIVSIPVKEIIEVQNTRTIDVRGEFIPLLEIEDVFDWYSVGNKARLKEGTSPEAHVEVVLLNTGGTTMGLRVDESLGTQDIVIKSLSDNYVNIRGLSGASVLGDGNVSLMLDVGTILSMAIRRPHMAKTEE